MEWSGIIMLIAAWLSGYLIGQAMGARKMMREIRKAFKQPSPGATP